MMAPNGANIASCRRFLEAHCDETTGTLAFLDGVAEVLDSLPDDPAVRTKVGHGVVGRLLEVVTADEDEASKMAAAYLAGRGWA
jgi:hypothetical protein